MTAAERRDVPALDVSRETAARLDHFESLVRKWTGRINLISKGSLKDVRNRHVVDSAQLLPLAPDFRHWADLGSGAGFPGLVVAILTAERPDPPTITLVESDGRKAAFLDTVRRELALPVVVENRRAEELAPLVADVVSARALASLADLLPLAHRHLAPRGVALFPKGPRAADEVPPARRAWRFDLTEIPSITDPTARILKIERLARA